LKWKKEFIKGIKWREFMSDDLQKATTQDKINDFEKKSRP